MVYKNDIDKYIQMKLKDIADNSMDKLKKHLVDINKSDMVSLDECLMSSRHTIERKYNDYKSKLPLQNSVNGLIANIYINLNDIMIILNHSCPLNQNHFFSIYSS